MSDLSFHDEFGEHRYVLGGDVVPSVTGILRAMVMIDFRDVPERYLKAARDRGTKVHQAVHYYNEHDLDVGRFSEEFPEYAGYVQSWIALFDSGRLRTALCEHRVASRRYRYAGTIDWLGEFDGRQAILDFATGDPEDCAKDLQTAGYLLAAREWSSEPDEAPLRAFMFADTAPRPIERWSVRLRKDGKLPTPHPYRNYADLAQFLSLVHAQQIIAARRPKAIDWTEYAA